jgi:alkylation response protein AidB-like acyl-CoA dehydrogenase
MILFFPTPTSSEVALLKKTKSLCLQQIVPTLLEDEKNEIFRKSLFNQLKKEGLTSLLIPKSWGGQEQASSTYYRVLIELARYSASYSITVGVHQMIQSALLTFGTEKQKQSLLPALVTGDWLGAFSLSESGSGSDAASLRTIAQPSSSGYILNGTKLWCSNGADADLFLVMARTGQDGPKGISAFLISKDTPGFRIGRKEHKLGLKASSLTELIFENCQVSSDSLLGKEGQGFAIALSQLDSGRIGIASTAIGLAQQALETVWREGLSGTIAHFEEGTKADWAQHYALLQAIFSNLILTAQLKDNGIRVTGLASQCKLLASDLAMQITSFAVETLGHKGVLYECGVERLMRDAKALQIVEGTNQIQKIVLARELETMVKS